MVNGNDYCDPSEIEELDMVEVALLEALSQLNRYGMHQMPVTPRRALELAKSKVLHMDSNSREFLFSVRDVG